MVEMKQLYNNYFVVLKFSMFKGELCLTPTLSMFYALYHYVYKKTFQFFLNPASLFNVGLDTREVNKNKLLGGK